MGRGESEQWSGWETSRRLEAPNRIWRMYLGGVNTGCHVELSRKPVTNLGIILQEEGHCYGFTHTHTHTSPLEPGPRAGVGRAMLGLPAWESPDWNKSSDGGPEHKPWPRGIRDSDRPTRPRGNQTLQKSWRPFPYKGNVSPEFFRWSGNLRGKSIESAVA